jgi:hypothetical protein
MNQELAKPETGDKTLVALGEKFSNLNLEEMKTVVRQTQFYKTADEAISLLNGDQFKTTMTTVQRFCVEQGLVTDPQYGFGQERGRRLVFDPSHLESWKEKGGAAE